MSKIPNNMSKSQYEAGERACTCGHYVPYNPSGSVFATMQIGDCINCNAMHSSGSYTSSGLLKLKFNYITGKLR